MWETDPGPTHPPVDIGGGISLPVYVTGPASHSWWAMVVLILVAVALYGALVFSYLYLWTVSPERWPAAERCRARTIRLRRRRCSALGAGAIAYASRALARDANASMGGRLVVGARSPSCAAFGIDLDAMLATAIVAARIELRRDRVRDRRNAGVLRGLVALMVLYTLARAWPGVSTRARRATFDNTMLLAYYTVAQGLVGLILVHGFPRLVA